MPFLLIYFLINKLYFQSSFIARSFSFRSMIHFELIFMKGMKKTFLSAYRGPGILTPFVERLSLLPYVAFAFCQRLVDYMFVSLFLISLFCSIDLSILSPVPHCLDYCNFMVRLVV